MVRRTIGRACLRRASGCGSELLAEDLEAADEAVDVFVAVGGGDLDPQAGVPLGDDGVAEADDEDAEFEEAFAHGDGFGGFVDDDGADGGG